MRQEKTDLRSRYTRASICDCLLKLLSEKALKNVTVSEVCRAAGINRGTFYNHFYDIHDVYENIEETLMSEVMSKFDNIKIYDLDYPFFNEIMKLISENVDLTMIIVSNLGESSLLKKIVKYVKGKYVSDFREQYPALEADKIETLFTYVINGSIGLITEWLKQDKNLSTEVIAERIDSFNKILVDVYLLKPENR